MEKWNIENYIHAIQGRQLSEAQAGHIMLTLNARTLMNDLEPGVNNLKAVCRAMNIMAGLESGDNIKVDYKPTKAVVLKGPKSHGKVSGDLTIMYNLEELAREHRKKKGPPAYGKEKKIAEKIVSELPDGGGQGGDIMR